MSQDTTLAYSMPYSEAPSFLSASQEIPLSRAASQVRYADDGSRLEEKKWIMKAVRNSGSTSVRRWIENAWTDFVDLLKVRDAYYNATSPTNMAYRTPRLWILAS